MGYRSPSSPHFDRRSRIVEHQGRYLIVPPARIAQGPLLPPRHLLEQQFNAMGNTNAHRTQPQTQSGRDQQQQEHQQQPRSNLSALLEEQQGSESRQQQPAEMSDVRRLAASVGYEQSVPIADEADSACQPLKGPGFRVSSAPAAVDTIRVTPTAFLPVSLAQSVLHPNARRSSTNDVPSADGQNTATSLRERSDRDVRRSISSKELGMLMAPTISAATGSPHTYMLHQKEILNATMQQRLMDLRESNPLEGSLSASPTPGDAASEGENHGSSHRERIPTANERRSRRRAERNKAVILDLCEIVTDLFIAESKLLNPRACAVETTAHRNEVLHSVEEFVSALPARYALGVDTPSEVLVHMRLMSAVRSDQTRAVVHIVNQIGESVTAHRRPNRALQLVTICCGDATGLLEYISRLLATSGSRVLDADVMLSTDGVCLDRFVVEMSGRLRLDRLANCIEAFLANAKEAKDKGQSDLEEEGGVPSQVEAGGSSPKSSLATNSPRPEPGGPIYVFPPSPRPEASPKQLHDEIQSAVPLSQVLESSGSHSALADVTSSRKRTTTPVLHHAKSLPNTVLQPILSSPSRVHDRNSTQRDQQQPQVPSLDRRDRSSGSKRSSSLRQQRPLINREATNFSDSDLHGIAAAGNSPPHEVPNLLQSVEAAADDRVIPLIPFEELMLIETLGMGRVSTIYRAAWQRSAMLAYVNAFANVEMVALKVATVNPETGDPSHMEELRREADIAAMLQNPNVCELIGVAADSECFCLAYEFCEGGSLLSLLSDTARYYEYLPIALDIANGMAYLHSRDVIHRDLKPSNILLTRDHRAKISDFGMSVANTGQELTAETGTYRYMAPEVIRHESYSSNADVYSFGIVLWQLITREVPFATMTPIQAAFAVAQGRRPEIPDSTPPKLREIITSCWDQDSQKRPSFTYIAMALADYASMAFSPANVGARTLQIANEMLASVEGNSTVNVDMSTPVQLGRSISLGDLRRSWLMSNLPGFSYSSNVGLEI